MMAVSWAERIASFLRSPSQFLSCTTPEVFLVELLRELRDDREPYDVKILLLSPLCEYPTLMCPSPCVGEETSLELMSVFSQCPPKHLEFRCQLLLALTSVLLCSSCVSTHSQISRDLLNLLLQLAQDKYELHIDVSLRSLRATACDCLRELEACCPGLLSQQLELLNGLRQQENCRHHQALAGLYTVVLRNAVYLLTKQTGAGSENLRALLCGNAVMACEAELETITNYCDTPLPSFLAPMGTVPTLQTGPECKELRSILSSLLEESYLLTPPAQAALLHGMIEVVAMVSGVPPSIFRAQLLRLLGTSKVCLFHSTLLMKTAFTDSLFSAEDEAFFLKRLVGLSQHPLLSTSDKLFYIYCISHFPENRPIDSGDGEETLPVLLTPRLAVALVPTVFNDPSSMLARLNLASLVYLEEGEEEEVAGGVGGLAYLYDHLKLLLHIVEHGGSRERVVTFFRFAFLFLSHFCPIERYACDLRERLCQLYRQHTRLAPHIINLANRAQDGLVESSWAVQLLGSLQGVITEAALPRLTLPDLRWHLRVLARVAEEGEISQRSTLNFLFCVTASPLCASSNWRLGTDVLAVCRRLLVHPSLDAIFCPLADVLQQLACVYGDTDIQDHARLYYSLLTTLSQEKLGGVLANGTIKQGRQDKKRSLSSIMAESEDLTSTLTIHQTERSVFQLVDQHHCKPERTSEMAGACEPDLDLSLNQTGTGPGQDMDVLEAYRSQFRSSGFASEVTLLYNLIYTDAHVPGFDQLFSIRLHFEQTDSHYEDLADVSVPCLFRDRAPPVVRLTLKPRAPHPTTIRASAIFTTQDGLTWHSSLPDVHVVVHQLFKPLPVPASWEPDLKLRAFEGLWAELCSGEGKRVNPPDSASSLFCCQLEEKALTALVEEHFATCYITDRSNMSEHKILLFLPPQSHLLLKVTPEEDAAQFKIATDNWKLLPFVNSFLKTITDCAQHSTVGN